MLHPKRNRLDYGYLLSPPDGYTLSRAIGTTYSLDLYALLALPVAMFYQKSLDGDFKQNRYDVLDAIQKSKERIDIFHQKGKVSVPKEYNSLLAFIDDCCIEIQPAEYNSSFHPKLWCLRFEGQDQVMYRLIIMSRNLTFDRSWDVSCYLDGHVTSNDYQENAKLSSFLESLYQQTGRQYDSIFFEEFNKVDFQVPEGFNSMGLHPIQYLNPANNSFTNPLAQAQWNKLLIVSPFIDKTTIERLNQTSDMSFLFSRKEELDKIDEASLEGLELFQFNPMIVAGEQALDSDTLGSSVQNLHAKFYIGVEDKKTTWLLGSANCTRPAFERNTEILLSLISDSNETGFNRVLTDMRSDENQLFEPYIRSEITQDTDEEALQEDLRHLLFDLFENPVIGLVSQRPGKDNFDLHLNWDLGSSTSSQFKILTHAIHLTKPEYPLRLGAKNEWKMENIPLTKISPFIVVKVLHNETIYAKTLLKIEVELPEQRDDAIFNDLINNKRRFQEYLRFLLSPDELKGDFEIPTDEKRNKETEKSSLATTSAFDSPIYEHLLIAASRNPNKLKEIDQVVERLRKRDPQIVADFLQIWNVFKTFING